MTDTIAGARSSMEATTDEQNPWLGLASYTEETRAYFYGREDEVAELARRVQRKLLTVLFGQSGLGKTSILRAGLVPRLRSQGYCPIYVRIDYSRDSPEPAEQIKEAISRTARHSGQWTQEGVATRGESLWEFLHHRDDVLRDEAGTTLIPLLIFDQFEEIFTLAQSDDFGRARAARFIEELADLVENRPPKALEERMDSDDTAAERFDFGRSDYRVLIALREDYLAPLESLKKAMPSISQNRLRLAPMTGTQALAAVLQPGRKLVTEEVAAAIVRFVAGGAELANAEVEPSLLSLICRELNDTRLAKGSAEISLDLLAGSHASILSNFYERALADQPAAVRHIVEEDLLTSSGYRENVAEERLLSRLKAAGADASTLATLVNRRLLRIEERLDVRRVELTHDVLCPVVKASRDLRHEREAREETEKLLAAQRDRELAARKALVRARQIASACIGLAVIAVAAAIFGLVSSQRARHAEQLAQQTRQESERARAGAEQLLGYLNGDVSAELESFGQLKVLAEFSKRQVDYFHALPQGLRDVETSRNGALAMIQYARTMRSLGDLKPSDASATESIQLLEALRAGGDQSEPTTIALARAYTVKSAVLYAQNDPQGLTLSAKGADLLRPLVKAPNASVALREAYLELLMRRGNALLNSNYSEEAVNTENEALQVATELGARDLKNVDAAALFTEASAWLGAGLQQVGRNAEARRISEYALTLGDRILESRPGNRLALHAQEVIASNLTGVAQNDLQLTEQLRMARRSVEIATTLYNLDPGYFASDANLGQAYLTLGDTLAALGRIREALPNYPLGLDHEGEAGGSGAYLTVQYVWLTASYAENQAAFGDTTAAARTLQRIPPEKARMAREPSAGALVPVLIDALSKYGSAAVALRRGEFAEASQVAWDAEKLMEATKTTPGFEEVQKIITMYLAAHVAAQADYLLGNFAQTERAERIAIERRHQFQDQQVGDRRDIGIKSTWLAMAIARQGRTDEAMKLIAPVVSYDRNLMAHNHGDQLLPVELAGTLYVQALCDRTHAAALLSEAATLIDRTPAELRATPDIRQWRERIAAGVPAG
jgi:tetratricopeptide (TPR) repeat protein